MYDSFDNETRKLFASSDMATLFALLLRLPTKELVAALQDGSLIEDVTELAIDLGLDSAEFLKICAEFQTAITGFGTDDNLHKQLRIEYTQLFTHPTAPASCMYETRWLARKQGVENTATLFTSPTALDVQGCIKDAGMKLVNLAEPADHLSVEMEYLAYLFMKRAEEAKLADETSRWQQRINYFLEKHVDAWWEDLFVDLQNRAETPLYAFFGYLGINYVASLRNLR